MCSSDLKYRKTHIPQVKGFWEKFYFRPGNLGYPVFDTAVGRIGVYICYDRHFPEGWRALGLAGARIVFNPSATSRGLSQYLWRLEQPASAVANEYFVGASLPDELAARIGEVGLPVEVVVAERLDADPVDCPDVVLVGDRSGWLLEPPQV